jgi:hypothetical protein
MGKKPTVLTGFRPTSKGLSLKTLSDFNPTKDSPLIVDITEFDKAIEYAESKTIKEVECLAKDRSALKGMLESIKRLPFIIAVMTCNTPIKVLQSDERECYTHNGAVDLRFQVPDEYQNNYDDNCWIEKNR